MKVVMASHNFYPHIGGLENVEYNQAKELVKLGHNVVIFSSKIKDEPSEEIMDGIKVIRTKTWNWFEDKWGVPYPMTSPTMLFKLWKEIKNADIVHVHDFFYLVPFYASLIAKVHKKPVIFMGHVRSVKHSKSIVNFAQWLVENTYGKFVLKNSERILVCNKEVGKWLKKNGKTVFLHNCVDKEKFYPVSNEEKQELRKKYKLPLNKPIVLFVGRIVECKNFDKLFEARDEDYLIIFIGPGNIPQEMEKNKDAIFIGPKSHAGIKEFYQLSDVFVLPSKHEGFPITILEAMACGLPIICSNLPGFKDYLDPKKTFLIKPTPKEIKEKIKKVISDDNLKKEMGNYSREKVEKELNWQQNTKKLLDVYQEVLKEHGINKK